MKPILATIIAMAIGQAADAQPSEVQAGTDRIWLEQTAADRVSVLYSNDAAQGSRNGDHTLRLGDVTVIVRINISEGGRGREMIYVTPPDDFIAVPPELPVQDGETGTILIVRPMF